MKRDNTMTQQFLINAGIVLGMRVMEIGCGNGEVTQVLAELVGPTGSVVAIDRNENQLSTARERMEKEGIQHVQFLTMDVAGDLSDLETFQSGSFDALVGRRVLMYLQNPAESLRSLSRWLRSGGLVVFEETDLTMIPARTQPLPAHDQGIEWLRSMLVAEGANTAMGFSLPDTLREAGLAFQRIRAEAIILGQGEQYPLSFLLKLTTPRFVSAGIGTQEEAELLVKELEAEEQSLNSVYVWTMSFCAWAHKP